MLSEPFLFLQQAGPVVRAAVVLVPLLLAVGYHDQGSGFFERWAF